ncbi:tyrosine-type recombinase/integrase [Macrococcus brunensis]|uniref:tyrosine-type recombinase/integrase n=1 Tax=Macrococcus brunensis TaxID=198483 RepID=UPI001EF06E4C|nr:tyrosine-type recombinase/integrase [Macrococcus brunensis]ULG72873.1 tyrosine-type recombinase/integrase [Macrococcus brunensis]ULG75121.1 tyrosine-type recombinase/integrase [Macrococcus brunensis]
MHKVDPIKDIEVIKQIETHLKERSLTYYFIFKIGINAPLKTEELVQLTVSSVQSPVFLEMNGFKILLSEALVHELNDYIADHQLAPEDCLFCSKRTGKPYTRQHLHRVLAETAEALNLDCHIGAQSLKKTFAYHAYQQGMELTYLQHLLGHQSKKMTLSFIDVPPETVCSIQLNL